MNTIISESNPREDAPFPPTFQDQEAMRSFPSFETHDGLCLSDGKPETMSVWTGEGDERELKRRRIEDHIDTATLATVVTTERSFDYCEEEPFYDGEGDDEFDDDHCDNSNEDVPSEVDVLIVDERDNDDSSCGSASYSSSSSEEDEDDEDDVSVDEGSDNESVESDGSECDVLDTSSTFSDAKKENSESSQSHELFLPLDTSPSFEKLKFEEDADDDSDEEEPTPLYLHRTYMIGNNRGLRPRMLMMPNRWNRAPCSVSLSSSSSTESSSLPSKSSCSSSQKNSKRARVSFDDNVTVYPVFKTSSYSDAMIKKMYTKREELRVNKLRNKREFAFDLHDWRNATEESEMERNEDGEFVHPVHARREVATCRSNLQHSPIFGGYQIGAPVVHRVKRMRMYYP